MSLEAMLASLIFTLFVSDLDRLLDDPKMHGAVISAIVLDESGRDLFCRNPDLRLVPASIQKLVTAAFALDRFGPDYKPETRFWKRDVLFVDAPGDPLMSYERLLEAKRVLNPDRATPLKVRQAYGPLYPAGWEWDDFPNRYAAPVSAFTVDQSAFELWTERGRLFFMPESYGAKARYVGGEGQTEVRFDPKTMRAQVKGLLPQGRIRLDTLAIGEPDAAAGRILSKKFSRTDTVPSAPPDYVSSSAPLSQILLKDLATSDNNISENLFLMASGVTHTDLEPYRLAKARVSAFLVERVGLDAAQFQIADGSGLSRHNAMSARAIAALLQWADRQPTRDIWRASLAKPGEPGTLEQRLDRVPFAGKTGTMDMVVTLTGYLRLNDGKVLTLAIMVNNQPANTAETRDFVDAFIRKVLDDGNEGTLFAESHKHEVAHPDPRTGPASGNRLRRSDLDGRNARTRAHSGNESSDARLHRAKRVALRGR